MKYLLTIIFVFLIWKVRHDWQRVQRIKSERAARHSALEEFEQLIFRLEMKVENGELTQAEFQQLRHEAMNQLQRKIDQC